MVQASAPFDGACFFQLAAEEPAEAGAALGTAGRRPPPGPARLVGQPPSRARTSQARAGRWQIALVFADPLRHEALVDVRRDGIEARLRGTVVTRRSGRHRRMKPSSSAGVSAASPAAAWAGVLVHDALQRAVALRAAAPLGAEPYTLVGSDTPRPNWPRPRPSSSARCRIPRRAAGGTAGRECPPAASRCARSQNNGTTGAPRSCRHRGWAAGSPPRHRPARRRPGSGRPGDRNRHRSRNTSTSLISIQSLSIISKSPVRKSQRRFALRSSDRWS